MYLAAECFVRLQICTCRCAHVVSFIPRMVTWSRWNEGGNRMTNIYKGQQAEGELRLEAATSTGLHHSDSFIMYIIRFVKKKTYPFWMQPYHIWKVVGGGGGGSESLNEKKRPWVVFKFLGPPWWQCGMLHSKVVFRHYSCVSGTSCSSLGPLQNKSIYHEEQLPQVHMKI